MSRLLGSLVLAAALAWIPASVSAQAPAASYQASQAEAGKAIFERSCVVCHGADLLGKDDAPPVAGAYFANSWGGQPVASLIQFVKTEMPFSAPGSLDDDSYVKSVAYILSVNGVPAGATALTMGAPGVITVSAKD
jgi:cytochrome c